MSKSSASVVVTVLFNIAVWAAPGIPEHFRWPIFYCTLALLIAACIWWAIAHWPTSGNTLGSSPSAHHVSGNVASAGRDVHQRIYHGASQPSLITFLITADHTYYSTNTWGIEPVRFLHAKISIDRGSVFTSAYLTRIKKGDEVKWEHGPEQLTFGGHTPGDPLPRMLHHGLSYNLDVLVIVASGNEIHVCNDEREWRRWPRLREIFAEKGDYILTITLAGDGAQSKTVELWFNWTGHWQDCFLKSNDRASGAQSGANKRPLQPIEIRDALDCFIRDGERLFEQWNPSNDAITASEIERQTLRWLASITDFVKSNLDVRHVDQLNNYQLTVKPDDRRKFSFNLAKRGVDIKTHPVAYELGFKVKVLQYFRDEIR